jgi:hypothetical protein
MQKKSSLTYFDKYHLLSSKHLNYIKFRKVYELIQTKAHLTPGGLNKIYRIKNSMNTRSNESLGLDD